MSLNHKREQLEALQIEYRRAWDHYAAEVELLQSGLESGAPGAKERIEKAAVEYRAARDEMALYLLDAIECEKEPELAACQASR
jgi:hypothetical protein